MRKRPAATTPILLLLLGVGAIAAVGWTLNEGRRTIDWAEEARILLAAKEYLPAIEAANKQLENDPDNPEILKLRADAASRLKMTKLALADYTTALNLDRGNSQLIGRRVALLMQEDRHEDAITFIDEQRESTPRSSYLRLAAANARCTYLGVLQKRLTRSLELRHPDRLHIRALIRGHIRSAAPDSKERASILAGLSTSQLREESGGDLDLMWSLVRESDAILGDLRTWSSGNASAMINRAKIDTYLGRLLQAKESLETALRIPTLPLVTRQRIRKQLADGVLLELSAHEARANVYAGLLAESVDKAGSSTAALEAGWFAATEDPARRASWREAADAQLRVTRDADIRTLAYLGLADLRWDPINANSAIERLKTVFDKLRLSRSLADRDLLVPERAELFIQGLLDAYHSAGLLDAGLPVANALLDFSPDDPTLRQQRARILNGIGRTKEAANDLIVGMRGTRRDRTLFLQWLNTASRVKDASGRTPDEIAKDAVRRYQERIDAYTQQIETAGSGRDFAQLMNDRRKIRETSKSLGLFELSLAQTAIIAWHMAEEFGRLGKTEFAQDFMLKATWAEPEVPWFRFRLGQILLDLDKTTAAAHEFESILDRFPEDTEAALYAYGAWNEVGEIARARDLRARAIAKEPLHAGLMFSARSALDRGDYRAARVLLTPYSRSEDPIALRWLGHARILADDLPGATRVLDAAARLDPDDAETALLLATVAALSGDNVEFEAAAVRFHKLPRLLPRARVDESLSLLEERGAQLAAARIASDVASRFTEETQLELLARGAMLALEAGDESRLLTLVRPAELGDKIPKDAIRACFAILLRDRGVTEAADWLKLAREPHRIEDRGFGTLTLSAAFALSSYQSQAQEYLLRYEQAHRSGIPPEDAAAWWVLDQRVKRPGRTAGKTSPLPGAEAELQWLESGSALSPVEGSLVREAGTPEDLGDRLLYVQLVRFTDGHASDSRSDEAVRSVLTADRRAMFAARVLALQVERDEGAERAGILLLSRYQSTPSDFPTFEMLGRLLRGTSGPDAAVMLTALGEAGLTLFPDRDVPYLLRARAAILQRQLPLAARNLRTLLEIQPDQTEAGEMLAGFAAEVKQDDPSLFLARLLGSRRTPPGPAEREFLEERYRTSKLDAEAVKVLTPILKRDPTFYAAAARLIAAYARLDRAKDVNRISKLVARTAMTDPVADQADNELSSVCQELIRAKKLELALDVTDAGLFAAPGSVRLRLRRVDLLERLSRETESVEDLGLLCALTPRDADVQFNFGEALLVERTDLAEVIRSVLPTLPEEASDDPRFHELNGYLLYLSGDIAGAADELAVAADGAPESPHCRYYEGLFRFLGDQPGEALKAFQSLPENYPLQNRVDWLTKQSAQ